TKPAGQGTGLGLSMVYGFVKQSGGHVTLQSAPGAGTTVQLFLPRSDEAEQRPEVQWAGPVEGGHETILVVEDDPAVLATTVETLSDLG
ncbi:ATP-binding protein, partial [Escherichia coli]|nr:ATP-binding protein [Escherichia coli]